MSTLRCKGCGSGYRSIYCEAASAHERIPEVTEAEMDAICALPDVTTGIPRDKDFELAQFRAWRAEAEAVQARATEHSHATLELVEAALALEDGAICGPRSWIHDETGHCRWCNGYGSRHDDECEALGFHAAIDRYRKGGDL